MRGEFLNPSADCGEPRGRVLTWGTSGSLTWNFGLASVPGDAIPLFPSVLRLILSFKSRPDPEVCRGFKSRPDPEVSRSFSKFPRGSRAGVGLYAGYKPFPGARGSRAGAGLYAGYRGPPPHQVPRLRAGRGGPSAEPREERRQRVGERFRRGIARPANAGRMVEVRLASRGRIEQDGYQGRNRRPIPETEPIRCPRPR